MTFVQYGCGFEVGEGWLNFDASPTLRIEEFPLIGKVISAALSGNSQCFPRVVKHGDIRKGLRVAPGTATGVYASHVLEHLSLCDFRKALENTYIMLESGGVFRLIVPDLLERARKYVSSVEANPLAAIEFIDSIEMGKRKKSHGLIGFIREFMGNAHHLWMWDEPSIKRELERVGFVQIRRCEKGDSGLDMFERVEDETRFFDSDYGVRECAIEARKP